MRCKSLLIMTVVMAVVAASVVYVVVFRMPSLRSGEWITTGVSDLTKPGVEYGYDFSPEIVTELAKRQPEEAQALVKQLWHSLLQVDEADLYRLKWLPDVCIEIDCQGVPSKDVKPYVDLVLSYKQSAAKVVREQLAIAISVAAFVISVVGLFIKRKA